MRTSTVHEEDTVKELRRKLAEAEKVIAALRKNEVDAVIGDDPKNINLLRAREVEEKLRRSEEKYRHLLQYAPTGIYEIDFHGPKFTSVNDAVCILSGYSREELLALNPLDILDNESKKRFSERMKKAISGQNIDEEVDYIIIRKDGTKRSVMLHIKPMYADGKINGALVVGHDVTERKYLEESLKKSQEQEHERLKEVQTILDTVPAYIWISHDAKSAFMTGSKATLEMLQLPSNANVSLTAPKIERPTNFCPYFQGKRLSSKNLPMQVAARTGKPVMNSELELRFIDGREINLFGNAAPLIDAQGDVRGAVGAFIDITNRKKIEEKLRESEEKFRAIIETANEGILIAKTDGPFTFVNQRMADMLGYTKEELLGKSSEDLAFDDNRNQVKKARADLNQGRQVSGEFKFRRKDGSPRWTMYNATPIFNDSGVHIANFGMHADITKRKQIEDALRESEERYRSVVENTTAIILRVDPAGIITFANHHALDFFGYSAQDLIGKHAVGTIVPPQDSSGRDLATMVDHIVADPNSFHRNANENICKDGRRVWIEWTNSGIYGPDGQLKEFLAVGIDTTELKQAEEAKQEAILHKQASLYARTLIEVSIDPLVTISPEGKITDVNEATVKATGVPREKLIGTDFASYFTEPEKAKKGYKQVFTKGYVTDYPLTIKSPNGKFMDVLYNASVYKDSHGTVQGVFASAREITARRQASLYARTLIEVSIDPLVTISPEGKITDVNEATVKATGVPREKLIGTDFASYFTEPEKAKKGYKQVFTKGYVTDYPLTIRSRDGKRIDVLYNASLYKDTHGIIQGVFAAARDVTKQKKAEAELKHHRDNLEATVKERTKELSESEERFRVTQELSPDGFTILHPARDKKGEIVDFTWIYENNAIARINGTTPEAVVGRRLLDLFPGYRGTPILESYLHVAKTGETRILESSYQGEIIPTATWLRLVVVSLGNDIAILAEDITGRRAGENSLKEARKMAEERAKRLDLVNKELESFSYSIAHDLRAPLRSINGFSSILTQDYANKLDEEGRRYLERIQKNATNMGDLIDDLLRLAKISQTELKLEPVDITRLSEKIVEMMREADPQRDITVHIENGMKARADQNLLEVLLKNLLSNAWKFTEKTKDPVISIGTTSVDGNSVFFVKDNGAGFDPSHANKLFKAFARLHGTEYTGSGIGLAIAQRIIDRHQGSIWAEGEIGKGATFYFSLSLSLDND